MNTEFDLTTCFRHNDETKEILLQLMAIHEKQNPTENKKTKSVTIRKALAHYLAHIEQENENDWIDILDRGTSELGKILDYLEKETGITRKEIEEAYIKEGMIRDIRHAIGVTLTQDELSLSNRFVKEWLNKKVATLRKNRILM